MAEGVADRIIGLYALGNSTREISDWMEENLGNRVSAHTINQWHYRPCLSGNKAQNYN